MVHPELADGFIIGQTGLGASGDLRGVLAMAGIRAPGFVPAGVAGVLFEMHVGYWIAGFLAGAAMIFAARNRASRGMVRAGEGILAVMVLWISAAALVVTPGERLRAAHEGLLKAAAAGDVERMVWYLAADFECSALSIGDLPTAKGRISALMKEYGVKGSKIVRYTSDVTGLTAYTRVTLATEVAGVGTVETTWGLSWEDVAGDDWKIELADFKGMGAGGEGVAGARGEGVGPLVP